MPTPTYTFTSNTKMKAAEFNANFALLQQCLDLAGGTLTGTLNGRTILPTTTNTYNVGSASLAFAGIFATALKLLDSNASHVLSVIAGSDLTSNRQLTINTGDANRALTLAADATIGGTHSGTSSGSNTGDQTVFGTISVSGQSDVVAEVAGDVLTLAAGNANLAITTNASSDTVTFTPSLTPTFTSVAASTANIAAATIGTLDNIHNLGSMQLSSVQNLILSSGNNNDLPSDTLRLRITPNADDSSIITGFNAGSDGQVALLQNVGTHQFAIAMADTNSSAANRFASGTNAAVLGGRCQFIIYDGTLARWQLLYAGS